jgi:hypothetical protein
MLLNDTKNLLDKTPVSYSETLQEENNKKLDNLIELIKADAETGDIRKRLLQILVEDSRLYSDREVELLEGLLNK